MASHGPPEGLDAFVCYLAEEALAECQVGVGFLQEGEVIVGNFLFVGLTDLSDFIASNSDSVVFGYSGQHLVLLSLIVEYSAFLFVVADALFAEEGVASGYNDRLGIVFGSCTSDQLSDEHHRAVANPGVAHLSQLSLVCHLHVLSEEVVFGYSHMSEVHIPIFLGMEAYLRANVAALDARQPVIVFVFDVH